MIDGSYKNSGNGRYVLHPAFAQSPERYTRSLAVLLSDFKLISDYVDFSDSNLSCYSYRIHGLIVRACIEVEANLKAILKENGYTAGKRWTMADYKKVNRSHKLSEYEAKVPYWSGTKSVWKPFSGWDAGSGSLPWYQDYNLIKHDRGSQFHLSTLENLVMSITALAVVVTSQFMDEDFSLGDGYLIVDGPDDLDAGAGGYFRFKYPSTWENSDRYEFDWSKLQRNSDPFVNFVY